MGVKSQLSICLSIYLSIYLCFMSRHQGLWNNSFDLAWLVICSDPKIDEEKGQYLLWGERETNLSFFSPATLCPLDIWCRSRSSNLAQVDCYKVNGEPIFSGQQSVATFYIFRSWPHSDLGIYMSIPTRAPSPTLQNTDQAVPHLFHRLLRCVRYRIQISNHCTEMHFTTKHEFLCVFLSRINALPKNEK